MPLSKEADALLTDFGKQPHVTADQVKNLRDVINASPALVTQINGAVAAGHLQHFAALPPGTNAGGSYDGDAKTMNLPLSILTAPAKGHIDAGEVTFVLGHELQHGFNNAVVSQAYVKFGQQVETVAKSAAAVHDYTAPVEALITANRRDEAGAEIAGWNAVVSAVHARNPHPTLKDIYDAQPGRMQDFIDRDASTTPMTYRMKPNLTVAKDFTMFATPANIEAMGVNYFDKPGHVSGLGHHGNSSYADYYGAYAVSVVAQNERAYAVPFHGAAPRLTLDMNRLHLHEPIIEQNGVDLGSNHARVPYYDSSTNPPALHHFDHTIGTHTHVPILPRPDATQVAGSPADPRHPAHPGHALYGDVSTAVDRLDSRNGHVPGDASERVKANLYALARSNGLTGVSDVVASTAAPGVAAGERLFVVQGRLDSPSNRVASMPTADALRTPVVEAFQRAETVAVREAQSPARDVAPHVGTPALAH